MVQTRPRLYTPQEYLTLEANADYKSEYRDGKIVAMAGGTTNHNTLAGNFYAHLLFALKGQDYNLYIGDVRLWIPDYRQYTYPDVMVIQGDPVYDGDGRTTITNPMLIIKVLSKSTQNYDQGDKFMYYRSIPTMREYILINQKQHYVIQHTKTKTGQWLLSEYVGKDASLKLNEIAFQISLTDLYTGINFERSEA